MNYSYVMGIDNIDELKENGFWVVGTAMENAVDEVKKVANYITKSHNEDGIVLFLERYLLNLEQL